MDLGIKGKWALVGGASKGLGLGCARALAHEGVHVVMVARGAEALNASAQALQKETQGLVTLIPLAADITTEEGRAAIWSVAGGPGKAYDIVVTNAGGPPPGDFRDWSRDDWVKAVDANMLTPIELIKATVDGMAERGFGRIVNITSGSVKAPIDVLGLSNGARSGLTGFVAGVARQTRLVSRNVTIASAPHSRAPPTKPASPLRKWPRRAKRPSRPSVLALHKSLARPAPFCAARTPATSRVKTS
jgi:3-oxoacyl-[acyl-carrier protein] reductase